MYCIGSTKQRRALAWFIYHPEADDELQSADGDEVIILEVVENGWWKGRVGNREGVFPNNFVEEILEVNEPAPALTEQPPPPSTGVCLCVRVYVYCVCVVCVYIILQYYFSTLVTAFSLKVCRCLIDDLIVNW